MIKQYCDCCGEEIHERIYHFSYLCHLDPSGKWMGYEECGEPVSGRDESKDLCLKCYNRVMSSAVQKFVELSKTTHNSSYETTPSASSKSDKSDFS